MPESRIIADFLLKDMDARGWDDTIFDQNVLQARSPATAKRLTWLIRGRLAGMDRDFWKLVRDGTGTVATHACLAAAVKKSPLLGDFLDSVLREQYRIYGTTLTAKLFDDYLDDCRSRDPEMAVWKEATRKRLRSSVFQTLAQAGYIDNTKTKKLQTVHIASQVLNYLETHNEQYVLRCIQVGP